MTGAPPIAVNADLMRRALWDQVGAIFRIVVTVKAALEYADYWKPLLGASCLGCNGTLGTTFCLAFWLTPWKEHTGNGHYFDLDMLEFGEMSLFRQRTDR